MIEGRGSAAGEESGVAILVIITAGDGGETADGGNGACHRVRSLPSSLTLTSTALMRAKLVSDCIPCFVQKD